MASSLYADGSTPVHRLNPVTKLVAVLTVIVVTFAVPHWWVSAIAIGVVVVPGAIIARCGWRLTKLALALLAPILIALTVVQGLTFPGGRTVLAEVGFLSLTTEGLSFALGIGSRITCLVLISTLFVLTTHPGLLLTALTERGMSPKFAYIISSTLQLIPSFKERADAILLAQQARGLAVGGGVGGRTRAMMPLLSPLILGMFTDVEERATAMEARGFGSRAKRTSLFAVPDSRAQRLARWAMPILGAALIAASIASGVI